MAMQTRHAPTPAGDPSGGPRLRAPRVKVRFASGGAECAAWHYPGSNGACVIMTGGFAVTKEPGTDLFASRFHEAGYDVLAFDYRHFGESGGHPRQVAPIAGQLADWGAAIAFAPSLPGVDRDRLAVWSFSASGGHIFRVAARHPRLRAAITQTPNADGLAACRNAARHQKPGAFARFTGRALLDAVGGRAGRAPRLVPLAGPPGTVAMLTTPDALDGDRALRAERYPGWQRQVAARSALRQGFYRPGRAASRVECPLLVVVCEQDRSALAAPAIRAAGLAPHSEVVRLAGTHYAPFLDSHEQAVAAELSFLHRHLIDRRAPATDATRRGGGRA